MPNNFTSDPSCKLWARMEPGALLVDSKGLNNLVASASPPTSDTGFFQEGSGSAFYNSVNAQYHYILDNNLTIGFPLKSGDVVKKATFCDWYKVGTYASSDRVIIGKWQTNHLCFALDLINGNLALNWATSNTVGDYGWTGIRILNSNNVYHIALLIDGVAKTGKLRIWDGTNAINYTHTYSSALNISTAPFSLGATSVPNAYINGNLDEVLAFNRLLSDDEIDSIRSQAYVISPPANLVSETTVSPLTTQNLDRLVSETTIEDIVAPLPNLASLSTMQDVPEIILGSMESDSLMQDLLLAIPDKCVSESRIQDIPPFNDGLFLIF